MTVTSRHRRSLLTAALGFLQPRDDPPEVAPLRRWLDSWQGVGDIVAGLNEQGGFDLELRIFQGIGERIIGAAASPSRSAGEPVGRIIPCPGRSLVLDDDAEDGA
jgi:hypothetical protein